MAFTAGALSWHPSVVIVHTTHTKDTLSSIIY
jgi:hypothetical protein